MGFNVLIVLLATQVNDCDLRSVGRALYLCASPAAKAYNFSQITSLHHVVKYLFHKNDSVDKLTLELSEKLSLTLIIPAIYPVKFYFVFFKVKNINFYALTELLIQRIC